MIGDGARAISLVMSYCILSLAASGSVPLSLMSVPRINIGRQLGHDNLSGILIPIFLPPFIEAGSKLICAAPCQ